MKIKNLLNLVMVLVATQLMFSCSSAKYYEFAAHKHAPYHQLNQNSTPETAPALAEIAIAAAEEKAAAKLAEPVLEASAASSSSARRVTPKTVASKAPITAEAKKIAPAVTDAEALVMAKERIASMTKVEKKELKKELREAIRQDRGGSRTNVVELILAILLPPLAVFLHDGIGTSFWINIILTLLFFIPGVIHALLVVTDTI